MDRFTRSTVVLVLLLVSALGCAKVAKKSPTMKATSAQFTMDAESMRIRARGLIGPFSGIIEESGDVVLAGNDDPEVALQALIWKADGLPAIRAALFRPDPLVALLDAWALSKQLIDYFETGRGREKFGEWADVPLEASKEIHAELVALMKLSLAPESFDKGEEVVGAWAAKHPITHSIAGRETILREAGALKAKAGLSGAKLIGSLAVTMDDMLRQMEVYTSYLPKQARWESQLAVIELYGAENMGRTKELLPVLLDSAEALTGSATDLPSLISTERQAVLDAIRRERIESLVFLRNERQETLDYLSAERVAVLGQAEATQVAITDALHAEIGRIDELIRGHRAEALAEAEEIAGRRVDGAFERASGLVDQIFVRLVMSLVLIFIGLCLLVLLTWFLFRPRRAVA